MSSNIEKLKAQYKELTGKDAETHWNVAMLEKYVEQAKEASIDKEAKLPTEEELEEGVANIQELNTGVSRADLTPPKKPEVVKVSDAEMQVEMPTILVRIRKKTRIFRVRWGGQIHTYGPFEEGEKVRLPENIVNILEEANKL